MEDLLDRKLAELVGKVEAIRLPGWAGYLENNVEAKAYADDQYDRLLRAVRDDDEVLFERAAKKWRSSFVRVNEHLAEEYRQANSDAELWELRYLKWMTKVVYIKLECPMGVFYLVPRRPNRKPRAKYWYTADEMLDMLSPGVAETIKAFGQLPVRPDSLQGPGEDEKHVRVDCTKEEPTIKYEFKRRGRGRKRIR